MKFRSLLDCLSHLASCTLAYLFAGIILSGAVGVAATPRVAPPETSRAQAIATVRSILDRNTAACRIDKVESFTAARTRAGWRVTSRLVMSASGRPLDETAVWTVRSADGESVAANQLTAEIGQGCP